MIFTIIGKIVTTKPVYVGKGNEGREWEKHSMLLRTMMERDLLSMFSVRTTLKGTDSPMVCVLPFLLS